MTIAATPTRPTPTTLQPISAFTVALGVCAFVAALLSFLGYVADVQRLTDWDNDGISIQPNATIAAMAAAAALVLLTLGHKRAATGAALLTTFIGGATLFEWVSGVDLGIDARLLFDRTWGRRGVVVPGRMGPPGSLAWTLLGVGLLLACRGRSARHAGAYFGVAASGIATLSLIGYLYGVAGLYSLPFLTVIALQTSCLILAIGVGLVLAVRDHGPARYVLEESAAGLLVRRTLPFVIGAPIALGWLQLRGETLGYYAAPMGTALLVFALIIVASLALFYGATSVARRERALAAVNAVRQRAELALQDANRRKDVFLATLAHELRNPLAPIRGAVEVLKHARDDRKLTEQARDIIDRQSTHMVRLVDDLMDISRITRDNLVLKREPVALASILQQSLETCRVLAEAAKQTLKVTLPAEPLYVDADPVRLVQVFGNLLGNACKFTPHEGCIELSAELDGDTVLVAVRDNGVGISADMLPRVFELFSQGTATIERSGGLGIGLALAKRVVELHGGSITADSAGTGQGSRFLVRLPRLQHSPEKAEDGPPLERLSARRVLVVDDNADLAAMVAAQLQSVGSTTFVAVDGADAIEKAEKYRPDLILLDVGLPVIDGLEVCRVLRQQPGGENVVILAVTGWGQAEDRQRTNEAGFDGHLVKPVELADLLRMLETIRPGASL